MQCCDVCCCGVLLCLFEAMIQITEMIRWLFLKASVVDSSTLDMTPLILYCCGIFVVKCSVSKKYLFCGYVSSRDLGSIQW